MARTKEQITKEINTARKLLKKRGRTPKSDYIHSAEGGIKSDFELPYSSLPKLQGKKWIQNDFFAYY